MITAKNDEDELQLRLYETIKAIRESHPDMVALYTLGRCFEFTHIVQAIIRYEGEIHHSPTEGHVYVHWKGAWWDIRGRHEFVPSDIALYIPDGDPAWKWATRDDRRLLKPEEKHPLADGKIGSHYDSSHD